MPTKTRQFEIRYDPASRVAYVYLKRRDPVWVDKVVRAGEDPQVTVDLDDAGKVIGIELLGVDPPVIRRMEWSNRMAVETVDASPEYL